MEDVFSVEVRVRLRRRLLFLFSAMFFVLPFPLLLGFILEKKNFCILATDSSFERCTKIYCSAHKILFADCLEIGNEVKCLTVNFSFSSLLLFFFLASTCRSRKLKGDEEFKKKKGKTIPLIFHNSGNFATAVTAVWSIQD